MVAPIAKTKTSEAIDLLVEMDKFKGSPVLDFKQRQFRKNYELSELSDPNRFYFCQAVDYGLDGELKSVIKSLSFIDYSYAPIEIAINSITLCRHLGLFFQAGNIIEYVLPHENRLTSLQTRLIAETCAILGYVSSAKKLIARMEKLFPQEADELQNTVICHLSELKKRKIKSSEIKNYWKQFEQLISLSIVRPRLFKRIAKVYILIEDGSNQLVIDFREYCPDACEDELYEISDKIADGLSLINSPTNILTFIVCDISASLEKADIS